MISMFDRQTDKNGDTPNLTTYWQSMNTIQQIGGFPTPQTIVVTLDDIFLIRQVKLVFIAPFSRQRDVNFDMRPQALSIFRRSRVSGVDWEPWCYYSVNCAQYFPGVIEQRLEGSVPSFSAVTPVCKQRYYTGDVATNARTGYGLQEVS